jgi:hypothetical protein
MGKTEPARLSADESTLVWIPVYRSATGYKSPNAFTDKLAKVDLRAISHTKLEQIRRAERQFAIRKAISG